MKSSASELGGLNGGLSEVIFKSVKLQVQQFSFIYRVWNGPEM